ncbi:Holliday junction branch migration protein RuvA [Dermabacteraceae bacterium TAE3-ERU5]|nr:Holliday junction branch migration protein RuvA [Dermabacteraceae bacterium TAE3-ERU5]
MIATLTGEVAWIGLDRLVLEVGGVGYDVRTTHPTLNAVRHGQRVRLFTELVVREDSLTLFGFLERDDADVFTLVQSVTGVGARTALALLSVLSPDDLRRAVLAGDTKAITKTPGIGPKVANRMILELKDKVSAPAEASAQVEIPAPQPQLQPDSADVVNALIGLGWQEKAASEAVQRAAEYLGDGAERSALLRTALKSLGGTR